MDLLSEAMSSVQSKLGGSSSPAVCMDPLLHLGVAHLLMTHIVGKKAVAFEGSRPSLIPATRPPMAATGWADGQV